jgi:hypothetical protein
MAMPDRHGNEHAEIAVEPGAASRGPGPAQWQVPFTVRNDGPAPIQLEAGWLPHGRFRAPSVPLTVALAPGEAAELRFSVAFSEPAGTEVENAFLILRLVQDEQPWRVFARLRVRAESDGTPRAQTELITRQRVGFSATSI